MRWIYLRLEARRTAVASVSTMIVLLVVSLAVPQRGDFQAQEFEVLIASKPWLAWADALRLTDIYRSVPMLGAFTLLLVNMWLSFAARLENVRKEVRVEARPATPGALARSPIYLSRPIAADAAGVLEALGSFVGGRGYRADLKAGSLRAVRNRFSVLGSALFHLSFLLLLVGLAARAFTSFHGIIVAGEGEAFLERPAMFYDPNPRYTPVDELPQVRFVLEKFTPIYENGSLSDAVAQLNIDGAAVEVRVNYPTYFGDTALRLVSFGFAPYFIVRETDKRIEHGAAVRLMLTPFGRADHFQFPDLPVTFTTRLYPDYVERSGNPGSRSPDLKNPAATVEFTDETGVKHAVLLNQGRPQRAGRFELDMPRVLYWCRFDANRDAGRWPMYAGFMLALVGLAWRMLLPRKRIDATLESTPTGAVLHVAGTPDYTREPFATELRQLIDEFLAARR